MSRLRRDTPEPSTVQLYCFPPNQQARRSTARALAALHPAYSLLSWQGGAGIKACVVLGTSLRVCEHMAA